MNAKVRIYTNRNEGVINVGKPSICDSPFGKVRRYNGIDQFVCSPRIPSDDGVYTQTIAAAAMITDRRHGRRGEIMSQYADGPGWALRWDNGSGRLSASFSASDGLAMVEDTQPNTAYLDTWHWYAAVYDHGAGRLRLYVDGELRAETATAGVLWHSGGLRRCMGTDRQGTHLEGAMWRTLSHRLAFPADFFQYLSENNEIDGWRGVIAIPPADNRS